jgi:hypothetical protein
VLFNHLGQRGIQIGQFEWLQKQHRVVAGSEAVE